MNIREKNHHKIKLIMQMSICMFLICLTMITSTNSKATAVDSIPPSIKVNYKVSNGIAKVDVTVQDNESGIKRVVYIRGSFTATSINWNNLGVDITNKLSFEVERLGNYTIMAEDNAGNRLVQNINITDSNKEIPNDKEEENKVIRDNNTEFNAVWISYLEFNDRLKDPITGKVGFTKARFEKMIDEMYDNVVKMKMNAVVVHVRPFGDAMYPSKYFPWSRFISGTQGTNPGFDPMEYMVSAAHKRGLEFHAWINPYRVTTNNTNVLDLAKTNFARRWLTDNNTANDRNIISHGGSLFFNPAVSGVRTLITNGISELVENYNIDGVHFDDYFYPALGVNHAKLFDSKEYEKYVEQCITDGKKPMKIANWRRGNVNTLIRRVYKAIKEVDETVVFGISPAGFLDSLIRDDGYYCDIKTWLSKPGYMDYICPQIYWSFNHPRYPFDKTLDRWLAMRTNEDVKMYVGIATYKAGSNLEPDWKNDKNVLKNQILYARKTGLVDGFMHFRYDFFYRKATQSGVKELLSIIKY